MVLLAGIQFVILSDYLVLMPMGPSLMATLGLQTHQFAGLVSVYSIGAIVVSVLTAGILDKFPRVRELQVVFLLFCIVSALHACARDFHLLLGLRFVTGGLAGLCGSLILSVISETYANHHRGRIIGRVLGATSLAQVVAIPVGLFLVAKLGWKAPFILHAILGGGICLGLFRIPAVPVLPFGKPHERTRVWSKLFGIIHESFHFKAMLCTLLTMFAGTLIIPFLPLVMVYQYQIAESRLGIVYLVAGVVAFVTSLIAGQLAERGTGRAAIYLIFSLGILPLAIFTWVEVMPAGIVIAVFTACNALFVVRMIPLNRFVMEFIHPDYLGGFQSINTALLHMGASLAAWTGGQLIQADVHGVSGFGNVALLSTTAMVLLFFLIQIGFGKQGNSEKMGD